MDENLEKEKFLMGVYDEIYNLAVERKLTCIEAIAIYQLLLDDVLKQLKA